MWCEGGMWATGRGGHKIQRRESQCVSILHPLSMVRNMAVGVKCTISRIGLICWKRYRKCTLQYVYEQWNLFTYTLIHQSNSCKRSVQIYNVAVLAASHQLSALLISTHLGRRLSLITVMKEQNFLCKPLSCLTDLSTSVLHC